MFLQITSWGSVWQMSEMLIVHRTSFTVFTYYLLQTHMQNERCRMLEVNRCTLFKQMFLTDIAIILHKHAKRVHDFFSSPVCLRWKRSAFPFGFKNNNTTTKTCTVSKLLWQNWFVTNITNSDRMVRRYSQISTKATNVLSKKILKTHFLNFVIRQVADRGTSHPTLS